MKRLLLLLTFVCSNAFAAITDGKFGINQIFDVQYYWQGTTLYASNFIAPYDKNFNTVTVTSGQYFQFFESTTNPGQYGLKLMNADGTFNRVIHDYGDITALGSGAIFYIGSGFFGNVISTATGYNYGASATFTNMDTSVTSTDLNNYTFASSTPLAAGQTATPTPSWQHIRMTGTPVYITAITPLVSNSPAAEQPNKAFDGSAGSKYLHYDKANSGITITLSQGRVLEKFTLTTANDSPGRDPTSYKLYGSNNGVDWTLIKADTLNLSNDRYSTSADIVLGNTNAYVYYFISFPTNKFGNCVGGDCNMVQIAEITFYYDTNNTTTSISTGSTIAAPGGLCCGGSSASFNANPTNTAKVQSFTSRTTADSQVYIEQIGNQNTITVNQSGTRNNYTKYYGNGSSNSITVTQSGNASTVANYVDLSVTGNSNTVSLTQSSTGGTKGIFATVNNDNNSLTVLQKDSGNHYAEIGLTGGNKSVNLTQQGSAGHMANISLSGAPTSLNLIQSGSTQQFYSIQHNCSTAGGCAAISVTQGQ